MVSNNFNACSERFFSVMSLPVETKWVISPRSSLMGVMVCS